MPATAAVVIKTDRLRDLLRKNEFIKDCDGLVIEGDLDLRGISFDHPLVMRNCTFKGRFDAGDAHFKRSLDLTGSTFEGSANFNGLRTGSNLILHGCTFKENVNLDQARIEGDLVLNEANIHAGSDSERQTDLQLLAVDGNLRAGGLLCEPALNLMYSRVRGQVFCSVAGGRPLTCSGSLNLRGVQIGGQVDFDSCQINGSLDLQEATLNGCFNCTVEDGHEAPHIGGDLRLPGARVAGQVALQGVRVDGDLVLYSAEVRCGLLMGSLEEHRTEIGGTASLRAVKVSVTINCYKARIAGDLNLVGAVLDGDLIANGVDVGPETPPGPDDPPSQVGDVLLGEARVTHEVSFDDARIATDLNLVGATIRGILHCQRARVGKDFTLNGARVSAAAYFNGIQVGGDFTLYGTVLEGEFNCQEADIAGQLNLVGAVVSGLMRAEKARVGNDFNLAGAKLSLAFLLSDARVAGNLIMGGAAVDGELRGERIEVGSVPAPDLEEGPPLHSGEKGHVVLTDARVTKDVFFNKARIAGGLHLDCAVVNGILHCRQAHIGSDLNLEVASIGLTSLSGTHVRGDLNLRGTEIKGRLVLNPLDEEHRTTIDGEAHLIGTRIGDNLNLMGARFRKSLRMERAVIQGELRITFRGPVRTEVGGHFNLESCSVGHAHFDDDYQETDGWVPTPTKSKPRLQWPQVPALKLRAFRFDTLTLPDRNYVAFLGRGEFTPSTYVLFEKYLRARGDSETANRVYLAMRERQRQKNYAQRAGYFRPLARLYDWFSDFFITWAIRSYRLFILYLVVVLVLTTWLFSHPTSVSLKAARAAALNAEQRTEAETAHAESWTAMKAFLMALQVNLPMIPIPAIDSWQPSQEPLAMQPFRIGFGSWKVEHPGGSIGVMTYQDYASLVSLFTTFIALPLLGGGLWTKLARERATDAA
jgi:hypothetical protein